MRADIRLRRMEWFDRPDAVSRPHANPMEQSPNQLPQKLPMLKYTRQSEIEVLSGVIGCQYDLHTSTYVAVCKPWDKDILHYRSSGIFCVVASRRCTTVPVGPPGGEQKYKLPLFTLFCSLMLTPIYECYY